MVTAGDDRRVTDSVTGAHVRGFLAPRAEAELVRATRTGGAVSLFLFDVDHFKSVNDTYGHQRGDEILAGIADRARGVLDDWHELFRYGGDEFVVLLPETGREQAVRIALSLVAAVRNEPMPGRPPLRVSVSLGVATFPQEGSDLAGLLACADRRNYIAKARGRGCAVADDAAPATVVESTRLLDREPALAVVNEIFTRLETSRTEFLAVTGPPGAGHTRFLHEVKHLGTLRDHRVLDLSDDDPPAVDTGDTLLIVADEGAQGRVEEAVNLWRPRVRAVGVAYTCSGATRLPRTATAELTPWSRATTRIWLRTALAGEPGDALVGHLHDLSGGLPGPLARETARLRERRQVERDATGAFWTISPVALGRTVRTDLPVPPTELIGREPDCDRILGMLTTARLVTLTGPGGIGKTRLSLAVAGDPRRTDSAVFVPLADVDRPEDVPSAVADALGAVVVPGEAPVEAVAEYLRDINLLLVLDNMEHVMAAADWIGELLDQVPTVRVLVTSRERLSLYGEQVYQVPPLGLPEPGASPPVGRAVRDYSGIALFERRARAADADFEVTTENLPAVMEICRRLGGLPLAIELAAARVDRWSPPVLLTHLENYLTVLDEGPRNLPARQRSLRGTIDWSVALLAPAEQTGFARLAAFAGGCTPEAAAAVLGTDGAATAAVLSALTAKNLLAHVDGAEPRFAMLEPIRAAALERLGRDEDADTIWLRHSDHYSGLAADAGEPLMGPDAAAWGRRLNLEFANIRVAFDSAARLDRPVAAAGICRGLWRWWSDGNHLDEAREWCDRLVGRPDPEPDLLYIAAVLAHVRDDHAVGLIMAERSLNAHTAVGDAVGVAKSWSALGMAASSAGNYPDALAHHARSLAAFNELGDRRGALVGLTNLARAALRLDDVDAAERYARQRAALDPAPGTRDELLGLEDQVEVAVRRGDPATARTLLARTARLSRDLEDPAGEALATHQLGRVELLDGKTAIAVRLFAEALELRKEYKLYEDSTISLETLAAVVPDPRLAAELVGAASAVRARHALPESPDTARARESVRVGATRALGERGYLQAKADGAALRAELVVDRVREFTREFDRSALRFAG